MKARFSTKISGFALVIVLSILALLVVLFVGLLTRATTERAAASGYNASIMARQLSNTVVGLVQGQINTATTQKEAGSGTSVPWVSQPGMVRTFDSRGKLLNAYKLYSAPAMISGSVNINTATGKSADEPPALWADSPALWVDLNAPVEVGGTKHFPILDGTCIAEGFSNPSAPGTTGTNDYQPVPMPVRWLYVLRDGQVVAPTIVDDSTAGKTATIAEETRDNPIVGRVAFWTDDDTCKVNINTASEGTYWDTPRFSTNADRDLANYQPAQHEFQRYPGHPAMTCLSSVFPNLTAEKIYKIVPRVVGEEVALSGDPVNAGRTSREGTVIASGTATPDSHRLYTSVDELLFKPDRTDNDGLTKEQLDQAKFFLTARSRAPETNLFNLPRIAAWPLKQDPFTFGNRFRTTPFDRLIALCSSIGPAATHLPYYFQRATAGSPTNDINIPRNLDLYKYLQYLTQQPVPGFGGDFLTKYGDDRDQILTEIFDYIRSANLQDAGVGQFSYTTYRTTSGSGYAQMPLGYGWVAPSHFIAPGGKITQGFGRSFTLSELALGFIDNATADIDDPANPNYDESHGSNDPSKNMVFAPTDSKLEPGEKIIQAIIVPEFFCPMQGDIALCPDLTVEIKGLSSFKITRAGVQQNLFPMDSGTTGIYQKPEFFHSRVSGGNPGWRYFGVGKGSVARGNLPADAIGNSLADGRTVADQYPFIGTPIKIKAPPISFPKNPNETMTFSGGELTVNIYANHAVAADPANLIQTIHIKWPTAEFPIPRLVSCSYATGAPDITKESWWTFRAGGCIPSAGKGGTHGRFWGLAESPGQASLPEADGHNDSMDAMLGAFFRDGFDVVRTMLPRHGDYRIVAGLNDVPDTVFVPHPFYKDTTKYMASNLCHPPLTTKDQGYDTGGKYFGALTYHKDFKPDIPSNATGGDTPEGTGDYDNCLSTGADGPYINKQDEGDSYRNADGSIPYFPATPNTYPGGKTFFSPNRQMPSPGMFGSLPSGIKAGTPWRTLLFRPQTTHPSYVDPNNYSASGNKPSDHLLMDLFWMPVVEPYAISDRFSTAGKINMNYQILPFTYLTRSTGIHALLKSEKLTVVPNGAINYMKPGMDGLYPNSVRVDIDRNETLRQFDDRFRAGKIFKSASEICDLQIVPQGQTAWTMAGTFWASNLLTGDNMRERIYTTLYPRLTTRSNTFTVHFCTQALKKNTRSTLGVWTEGKDVVLGEFRGSTTIERFIDVANTSIPDYAKDPNSIPKQKTLDSFYKWRVVENKQFAP
ncbi:MAG: Verru_Chthon cassette protein A [Chthoniobacteraceae bacterium]|nr:Verru_Chthon cassette protein A [Chthoniobacteraceae bacterium]